MKIKVLRDYSGQEGTDVDRNVPAGSIHIVTRERAAHLEAVRLAEIIGKDEHPDDLPAPSAAKSKDRETRIAPIASKAARKPRNKAAPAPENKEAGQ
ncbi:hypothetical protein [Sphingomonas montanisoli]|uniref:Uncharacterized protein n=1 Tax=Sphingomonas montanisoli TaxID=2606412 RepID=A0A5D9C627_9SPHN|nr:hypothetical protein [Sphingomonas montanisoli]TZG26500.1 hypothetical protein FYJ91_16395 [Sphingomonas montanisoli]